MEGRNKEIKIVFNLYYINCKVEGVRLINMCVIVFSFGWIIIIDKLEF